MPSPAEAPDVPDPPPHPAIPRSEAPASPVPAALRKFRRVNLFGVFGPPGERLPFPSATAILLFGLCPIVTLSRSDARKARRPERLRDGHPHARPIRPLTANPLSSQSQSGCRSGRRDRRKRASLGAVRGLRSNGSGPLAQGGAGRSGEVRTRLLRRSASADEALAFRADDRSIAKAVDEVRGLLNGASERVPLPPIWSPFSSRSSTRVSSSSEAAASATMPVISACLLPLDRGRPIAVARRSPRGLRRARGRAARAEGTAP